MPVERQGFENVNTWDRGVVCHGCGQTLEVGRNGWTRLHNVSDQGQVWGNCCASEFPLNSGCHDYWTAPVEPTPVFQVGERVRISNPYAHMADWAGFEGYVQEMRWLQNSTDVLLDPIGVRPDGSTSVFWWHANQLSLVEPVRQGFQIGDTVRLVPRTREFTALEGTLATVLSVNSLQRISHFPSGTALYVEWQGSPDQCNGRYDSSDFELVISSEELRELPDWESDLMERSF